MRRAAIAASAALWPALVLAGCGSGSTPSPTPPPTSAAATAVDPCLVGTWKAVSVTGSLTDPGGSAIRLAGGAGGVLTVNADGSLHIDDTNAQPDTGTANDGSVYTITSSGSGSGRVVTTAGQLTVTLDTTAAITQTIARNGTVLSSQTPTTATDTYQCTRGRTLVITSPGGIVSTYTAAG